MNQRGTGGVWKALGELAEGFRARRSRRKTPRAPDAFDRAEAAHLEALPAGPGLPTHLLDNSAQHVTERDVLDLPDGWYYQHRAEFLQQSKRIAIPPRAVALGYLLAWAQRCSDRKNGPGAQWSASFIARKLGCTRQYVHELRNKLQARGLLLQYRQCKRFAPLALAAGLRFQMPDGLERLRTRWRDRTGKLRSRVDLRSVWYLTELGRKELLDQRPMRSRKAWITAGRPRRSSPAYASLRDLLSYRFSEVRIRLAPAASKNPTPYRSPVVKRSYSGRRATEKSAGSGTDPPQ